MGRYDKKAKDQKNSKYLEHGTIVLNTITRKVNVHNTIYCWRIFKYPKLQSNVIYFQEFSSKEFKCILKLLKTKNTLYLCLRCNQLVGKTAQFYVMSETQPTLISVKAEEIRDGLYVGEFKHEQFDTPDLPYLHDGMLTISFRYISDQITDEQESAFDGADVLSDIDELCCDLKHMYLESIYPDFEIKVKGYAFKTHKFLLYARCKLFKELFDRKPEATEIIVDAFPGILHEVLLYIYCGELKDMDLACMVKVFELANYFKISSLVDDCEDYFSSRVYASNFDEFSSVVREVQSTEVKARLQEIKKTIIAS